MKLSERINYILLGTLWLLSIVLVLDFWLNTTYNFNIFSSAHWKYISNLQALHKPIKTGFYISITLAIVAGISGLYMLCRPRFRKIILSIPQDTKPEQNTNIPEPEPVQQITTTSTTSTIQRPPHLHIQVPPKTVQPKPIKTIEPISQPVIKKQPLYMQEIREIFETNNYRVLNPQNISNVPLSLIALGTNETLWLGACDISHEQMADVMLAFQSVFQETLGDIEISINAFIIKPSDNEKVDTILDINSLEELSKLIADNPNEPESEEDKESGNMDAFAGYIETVITYLGNK